MKLIVLILSLCSLSVVRGDWNPEELELSGLEILQENGYLKKKSKVLSELRGNSCTADKAKLLMDFVSLARPRVCVEIGVYAGGSAIPILAALKCTNSGVLYAVDSWSILESVKNINKEDPNLVRLQHSNVRGAKVHFLRLVKSWKVQKYCKVVSVSSERAVTKIPDIDFLHIDGNYSELSSLEDVKNYLPKVKIGGHILLSNIYIMVNGKQPKLKALSYLHRKCELVCEIEEGHAALFRKDSI